MPVHNGGRFLKETIESVLKQTCKNFEFIIVDDKSTDNSLKIIKDYKKKDPRIKILENKKNLGLTLSLNKALKYTKGAYIARIDCDDLCLPTRFAEQIKFLDNHKNYGFVGCWVVVIDTKGKTLAKRKHPATNEQITKNLIKFNPFTHSTLMIRKTSLKKEGYYNENFKYSQDYELIVRLAQKYQVANLPKYLVKYRFDSKSISYKSSREQKKCAFRVRLIALKKYNYPKWQIIYLIWPIITYLTPVKIKLFLLNKILWKLWKKKNG